MPNWKKVIVSGSDALLNSLTTTGNITSTTGGITGSDVTIEDWGSVSASLASINATGSNQNLQQVTDNGNVTTNAIAALSFSGSDISIDEWGSVSASLASINTTSSAQNLQQVTDNGNSTTNKIIVQGVDIGRGNNTATGSVAVGDDALKSNNSTGVYNTAIGDKALEFNTTGQSNTAVGQQAAGDNRTGFFNVAVGSTALFSNQNGRYNIAIGTNAGSYVHTSNLGNGAPTSSIFIGANTKASTNNNENQIVIGYEASGSGNNTVTIGNSNITDNYFSGNISGSDVTIDGWGSVSASLASIDSNVTLQEATDNGNTTTNDITVAGDMQIHKGPNSLLTSIAIGSSSLQNDESFGGNIAIGVQALKDNTTGDSNIAIGWRALSGSINGNSNIAIGYTALLRNTSGTENTAVGDNAMRSNTTGDDNTALGRNSLGINSGDGNVALGYDAHYGGVNSNYNTSVGFAALYGGANTGGHSVAIGAHAAGDIPNSVGYTKPTDGVYIGAYTIGSAEYTTNEIVIGAYVTGSGNNTVTIGNSNITNNYFSGDIDADDITIDDWGSVSASLASLESVSNPTLQVVTDNGATTTNSITISGSGADLILTGGSGSIETDHTTTFSAKQTIPDNNITTVFSVSQLTYVGGVVEYTFFDDDRSNMRSGIVTMVANSTATRHSELVTTDIGNTDNLEIQVVLTDSGFGMRVNNNTGSSFTAVCNVKVLKE